MLGLLDLAPVLVDDGAVVLAELLADRLHLLAQEVLALLLLRRPPRRRRGSGGAPAARRGARAGSASASSSRSRDVERLEQLDLLLEGEVGRVAGGVGERAGLGDRAHEGARCGRRRRAARGSPRRSRGTRARARACARRTPSSSGRSSTSTRRRPCGVGARRAGDAAVEPVERDGAGAAGQADALGHLGDGADGRVLALVARDEQDALLVADVDGRVTFMFGKTTMSSRGTSSIVLKPSLLALISSIPSINYKKCSGIPRLGAVAAGLNLRMIGSCRELRRSPPATTRRRSARASARSAASAGSRSSSSQRPPG